MADPVFKILRCDAEASHLLGFAKKEVRRLVDHAGLDSFNREWKFGAATIAVKYFAGTAWLTLSAGRYLTHITYPSAVWNRATALLPGVSNVALNIAGTVYSTMNPVPLDLAGALPDGVIDFPADGSCVISARRLTQYISGAARESVVVYDVNNRDASANTLSHPVFWYFGTEYPAGAVDGALTSGIYVGSTEASAVLWVTLEQLFLAWYAEAPATLDRVSMPTFAISLVGAGSAITAYVGLYGSLGTGSFVYKLSGVADTSETFTSDMALYDDLSPAEQAQVHSVITRVVRTNFPTLSLDTVRVEDSVAYSVSTINPSGSTSTMAECLATVAGLHTTYVLSVHVGATNALHALTEVCAGALRAVWRVDKALSSSTNLLDLGARFTVDTSSAFAYALAAAQEKIKFVALGADIVWWDGETEYIRAPFPGETIPYHPLRGSSAFSVVEYSLHGVAQFGLNALGTGYDFASQRVTTNTPLALDMTGAAIAPQPYYGFQQAHCGAILATAAKGAVYDQAQTQLRFEAEGQSFPVVVPAPGNPLRRTTGQLQYAPATP